MVSEGTPALQPVAPGSRPPQDHLTERDPPHRGDEPPPHRENGSARPMKHPWNARGSDHLGADHPGAADRLVHPADAHRVAVRFLQPAWPMPTASPNKSPAHPHHAPSRHHRMELAVLEPPRTVLAPLKRTKSTLRIRRLDSTAHKSGKSPRTLAVNTAMNSTPVLVLRQHAELTLALAGDRSIPRNTAGLSARRHRLGIRLLGTGGEYESTQNSGGCGKNELLHDVTP